MRNCPACGRDSVRNMAGTNHLACDACGTVFFHEGNAFVEEPS